MSDDVLEALAKQMSNLALDADEAKMKIEKCAKSKKLKIAALDKQKSELFDIVTHQLQVRCGISKTPDQLQREALEYIKAHPYTVRENSHT